MRSLTIGSSLAELASLASSCAGMDDVVLDEPRITSLPVLRRHVAQGIRMRSLGASRAVPRRRAFDRATWRSVQRAYARARAGRWDGRSGHAVACAVAGIA